MSKKTQNDLVYEYLKTFGSITSMQAFQDLGITRLGARIYDLRQSGHMISDEMINVPRRNGEKTQVKKYRLITEPQTQLQL